MLHLDVTLRCYTHMLHLDVTLRCYTQMLHLDVTLRCYTQMKIVSAQDAFKDVYMAYE